MMNRIENFFRDLAEPSKVLAIKAEPGTVKLYRDALDQFDVEVSVAITVEQARQMIREQRFAIIFLDLLLLDGFAADLAGELEKYQQDTPTVIVWASLRDLDLAKFQRPAPISLMEKPLRLCPEFFTRTFRMFRVRFRRFVRNERQEKVCIQRTPIVYP